TQQLKTKNYYETSSSLFPRFDFLRFRTFKCRRQLETICPRLHSSPSLWLLSGPLVFDGVNLLQRILQRQFLLPVTIPCLYLHTGRQPFQKISPESKIVSAFLPLGQISKQL